MDRFKHTLCAEIDAVLTVDPHSHLRPGKPEADNLADIVFYHHVWIELVSSGMPIKAVTKAGMPHETADPEMPPLDRLRAALPYLANIGSTTCGNMLRTILRDLYDVPDGRLTAGNLEDAFARVAERNSDPGWRSQLLGNRCRIARSLTVEGGESAETDSFIGRGMEGVPATLQDPRRSPLDMFGWIEHQLGETVNTAGQYAQAMRGLGRERANRDIHFVGMWALPHLRFIDPPGSEVTQVIADVKAGRQPTGDQQSALWSFGVRRFLEGMREGRLRTIQLIVGAEVLPPHRSITMWNGDFAGALGRLAGAFEDFHFSCSSACDANIQDLGIVAKHVPNVSVVGYWWHVLYPWYIRKSIETRLDMVPANKIVAFFSDAYCAEWVYPKLKLVKQIWAEALVDRVERQLMTEDVALALIRQVFYENPARIYGVS